MRHGITVAIALCAVVTLLAVGCGGGSSAPAGTDPDPDPTPPTLSAITPSAGTVTGGTLVTLSGTGFVTGSSVQITFDGADAVDVTPAGDSTCTCRTPSTAGPGPVDVQVTTADGSASLPGAFTYHPFPYFPEPERRLDTDEAGAAESIWPEVCCSGSNVYAVWRDSRGTHRGVFFNRSTDGGRTWLPEDVRIDQAFAGLMHADSPAICCSGENVYVVWGSQWAENADIYFNRSTDGGLTWLTTPTRLSFDPDGAPENADTDPEICCDGDRVSVCWLSWGLAGSGDWSVVHVHCQASADRGTTWLPTEVRVDVDKGDDDQSQAADIACSGSRIYLVWPDFRNGQLDLFFQYSPDGGQTWGAHDVRLDTDAAGASDSIEPELRCAGSNVYVAWRDHRVSGRGIFFNHSEDGGLTWQAGDTHIETVGQSGANVKQPQMCCSGDRVYLAWGDDRHGSVDDIQFTWSEDRGANWMTQETRLSAGDPGTTDHADPRITCSGLEVHVVWAEMGGLYLTSSVNGGLSFLDTPLLVAPVPAGKDGPYLRSLACRASQIHVAWWDYRDGEQEPGGFMWTGADVFVLSSEAVE